MPDLACAYRDYVYMGSEARGRVRVTRAETTRKERLSVT
jgi:hypothetical protein